MLLREHFLGDYRRGLDLGSSGSSKSGGYAIRDVSGEPVYEHSGSGVKTWTRALDFTPPGASVQEVLFHYTTETQFSSICGSLTHGLWSLLQDEHGLFGSGIYCSASEAAALGSREGVSRYTNAFCLDDWETYDFCIPIMACRRDCIDLRRSQLPEMIQGPGKSIHGRAMEDGVDVRVFKSSAGPATALKSLRSNAEERLRLEVVDRNARLGSDHPHTMQSMNSLVSCLRLQDKTREAERYASGTAADVVADASLSQLPPGSTAPPPSVAPVAGAGLDQAAIARAAANVLAATQGVKGSVPAGQALSQAGVPGKSPETRSKPEAAPFSSSNGVSAVEVAVEVPVESMPQMPNISGEDCMTLDDLESEATSTGGREEVQESRALHGGEASFADDHGDFGSDPLAEIDANLQWSSVRR